MKSAMSRTSEKEEENGNNKRRNNVNEQGNGMPQKLIKFGEY